MKSSTSIIVKYYKKEKKNAKKPNEIKKENENYSTSNEENYGKFLLHLLGSKCNYTYMWIVNVLYFFYFKFVLFLPFFCELWYQYTSCIAIV